MKTVIFTHADSVEVYGNKLVIIGIFDTINCDKFPAVLRPFGVAIKVRAEPRDYGKTYDAKVSFKIQRANKPIIEVPIQLKFPKSEHSRMSMCIYVLNFSPIKLEAAGRYVLELKVGAKLLCNSFVDVVGKQAKKGKK